MKLVSSGSCLLFTDACSQAASFVCRDQRQVIDRVLYCNGRVDCEDASDEPAHCGEFEHLCIHYTLLYYHSYKNHSFYHDCVQL